MSPIIPSIFEEMYLVDLPPPTFLSSPESHILLRTRETVISEMLGNMAHRSLFETCTMHILRKDSNASDFLEPPMFSPTKRLRSL